MRRTLVLIAKTPLFVAYAVILAVASLFLLSAFAYVALLFLGGSVFGVG